MYPIHLLRIWHSNSQGSNNRLLSIYFIYFIFYSFYLTYFLNSPTLLRHTSLSLSLIFRILLFKNTIKQMIFKSPNSNKFLTICFISQLSSHLLPFFSQTSAKYLWYMLQLSMMFSLLWILFLRIFMISSWYFSGVLECGYCKLMHFFTILAMIVSKYMRFWQKFVWCCNTFYKLCLHLLRLPVDRMKSSYTSPILLRKLGITINEPASEPIKHTKTHIINSQVLAEDFSYFSQRSCSFLNYFCSPIYQENRDGFGNCPNDRMDLNMMGWLWSLRS